MKRNREGYLVSETHRQCTNCRKIFEKKSNTVTLCPSCNSGRVKSQNLETKIYRRAKSRAKQKGLEFDITPEDVKIPSHCPILGIPLYASSGKPGAYPNSPSLDRRDSSKGYTKDNIWVISQMANVMKSNATPEMLKAFARWVLENYD